MVPQVLVVSRILTSVGLYPFKYVRFFVSFVTIFAIFPHYFGTFLHQYIQNLMNICTIWYCSLCKFNTKNPFHSRSSAQPCQA